MFERQPSTIRNAQVVFSRYSPTRRQERIEASGAGSYDPLGPSWQDANCRRPKPSFQTFGSRSPTCHSLFRGRYPHSDGDRKVIFSLRVTFTGLRTQLIPRSLRGTHLASTPMRSPPSKAALPVPRYAPLQCPMQQQPRAKPPPHAQCSPHCSFGKSRPSGRGTYLAVSRSFHPSLLPSPPVLPFLLSSRSLPLNTCAASVSPRSHSPSPPSLLPHPLSFQTIRGQVRLARSSSGISLGCSSSLLAELLSDSHSVPY